MVRLVATVSHKSCIFAIQLFLDEFLPEKRHNYSPVRSEVGPLSRERYLLRAMIAGGGALSGHGAA